MKTFTKLYDEVLAKEQTSIKTKEGASYIARAIFISKLISMHRLLEDGVYTDLYFQKATYLDLHTVKRCKKYFQSLGLIKTESSRKGTKYTLFKDKIDSYYSKPGENDSFFSNQSANDKVAVKDSKEDIPTALDEIARLEDYIQGNIDDVPVLPSLKQVYYSKPMKEGEPEWSGTANDWIECYHSGDKQLAQRLWDIHKQAAMEYCASLKSQLNVA